MRGYVNETLAVRYYGRMNDQLEAASEDFNWRALGIALLACLALVLGALAHSRVTPGRLKSAPPLPAKQRPTHRATPTGDPVPVCRAASELAHARRARA